MMVASDLFVKLNYKPILFIVIKKKRATFLHNIISGDGESIGHIFNHLRLPTDDEKNGIIELFEKKSDKSIFEKKIAELQGEYVKASEMLVLLKNSWIKNNRIAKHCITK